MFRRIFLLCVALFLAKASFAAVLKVDASGDSNCGWGSYLQNSLAGAGYDVQTAQIARGGATTWLFNGEEYPWAGYNGNETWPEGVIDYTQQVLDFQPDVITFMIGTNDVIRAQSYAWPDFQHCLNEIYDRWAGVPNVIVGTILPQLGSFSANNQLIDGTYNPYIKAQAAMRGFKVLDVNSLIQQEANWQAFYSPDGIHLGGSNNGLVGGTWLAQQWSDAVVEQVRVWKGLNPGWDDSSNWVSSFSIPNAGVSVYLGNDGSSSVVEVSSAAVGNLFFNSETSVCITGAGNLILDNNGFASTINVVGEHEINVPLVLQNDLQIRGGGDLNLGCPLGTEYSISILQGQLNVPSISAKSLLIGEAGISKAPVVPEPSTAVMVFCIFAGLFWYCRKR